MYTRGCHAPHAAHHPMMQHHPSRQSNRGGEMPVIANVHDSHHLVHLLHAAALIGAVLERRQVVITLSLLALSVLIN